MMVVLTSGSVPSWLFSLARTLAMALGSPCFASLKEATAPEKVLGAMLDVASPWASRGRLEVG